MKQKVTVGIVLARTNYGEADRILTVLTSDQGKIRLLAKGVRRIKSRLAGGIELFSINDITYIEGRGDLGTLVSARVFRNFGDIVKDVNRTMFTYEILKQFNKLTEDSPEQEYYIVLARTLQAINNPANSLDAITLWMHMQLLRLSGHSPNLVNDKEGKKLESTKLYMFDFETMSFSEVANGPFGVDHIKLLRLSDSANSAIKIAHVANVEKIVPSLVQLTRTMLTQHTRMS